MTIAIMIDEFLHAFVQISIRKISKDDLALINFFTSGEEVQLTTFVHTSFHGRIRPRQVWVGC